MKIPFSRLIIYCFMLLPSAALAAVFENDINLDAEKMVLSGSVQYIDNYHPRQSDGINATALSAGINGNLVSMHQSIWLQATYSGTHTQFKLDNTDLDLDDRFGQYNIGLLGRVFMGDKWYVDLEGTHQNVDYLLGTGIAKLRPASSVGDSQSTNQVAASLVYGSGINSSDISASRKILKLGFSHSKQDYADKNTYSNLFDLTRDKVESGLILKLSDITQFETSFEFESVNFVDDSQLDNDVYRLLLGLGWQGTGQTRFNFLVGGYKRVYQSGSDNQGFLAELDAEYTPLNNLSITLKGSQTTTTGIVENALDTIIKSAKFAISYGYKEHIKFTGRASISTTEYEQNGEYKTNTESVLGIVSKVLIYDYSSVSLVIQKESLENDFLNLDYVQNKVELNCRYAF